MGSAKYDKALQDWINSETKDFLSDQVQSAKLPQETVMALCTTIYFRGKWIDSFIKERTDRMVFHGAEQEQEADFMHVTFRTSVYGTDKFTAFTKPFNSNASMTFILPDEGVSAAELINDDTAMSFITTGAYSKEGIEGVQRKSVELTFSLPRFDIMSDISLNDGLKQLGVTDVFDEVKADFSPVTDEQIVLSDALHSARVKVDEEGCEAAAFTLLLNGTTAFMEMDSLELVFDRPFIFTINDKCGNLIFVGLVNNI